MSTSVGLRPGPHKKQIASHLVKALFHIRFRSLADGDHSDDRSYTDDDPQGGKERAHFIPRQSHKRHT
jgi:hypothetical protein